MVGSIGVFHTQGVVFLLRKYGIRVGYLPDNGSVV